MVSLAGEMVTWKLLLHLAADTVWVGAVARTSSDTSRSTSNRLARIIIVTGNPIPHPARNPPSFSYTVRGLTGPVGVVSLRVFKTMATRFTFRRIRCAA